MQYQTPREPGQGGYPSALSELDRLLLSCQGMENFLPRLAALTASTVGEGMSCAIALQYSGRPLTVATSDPLAALLQEVEYSLGQGPSLECLGSGETVIAGDLAPEDQRWPAFAQRAAATGILSCLSVPAGMRGMAAVLSCYAASPHGFGSTGIRRAQNFAEYARGALILGQRQDSAVPASGNLRSALAGRAVIDQALGVIMARQRCTSGRAWAILRTAAHNRNLAVDELARQIVARACRAQPQSSCRPGPS